MSQYFRWMKNKKEDLPFVKPRSHSLDARGLDAAEIRRLTLINKAAQQLAVLRPCGEDGSPDGVACVRAQDIRLHETMSQSERTSSTEEVSQTIPEEEEDATIEKNTQDEEKSENHKDDSDTSLPDSPVIENKTLSNENMFREVTVTGGGE